MADHIYATDVITKDNKDKAIQFLRCRNSISPALARGIVEDAMLDPKSTLSYAMKIADRFTGRGREPITMTTEITERNKIEVTKFIRNECQCHLRIAWSAVKEAMTRSFPTAELAVLIAERMIMKSEDHKGVYKMHQDFGRHGEITSVFVAKRSEIARIRNKIVFLGEALGERSEVEIYIDDNTLELISEDPAVVCVIEEHKLVCGPSPFDYFEEEEVE